MNRCCVLIGFFALALNGARAAQEPGADIFATNAPVLRIQVEIPREGIRSLEREPRTPVKALVREGNRLYTNVAVHVKGAVGSFRGIHDGPSLTLSFSKFAPDQRFHGLRKIHINNSVQDRSFSTYRITSDMFNDAGVPAARVTNARFTLNGRDLGFYVVVEGFGKEFLQRYFKDATGNLYDGGFLTDINQRLEKDAGDDRTDQPDLTALVSAANIPDPGLRWAELQKRLDVDRFLSFMALEVLMWDWDGYIMKPNNYRVYHDPATRKLVFIPHGMDQMFHDPNGSIYNPVIGGLVARAIVTTPEASKLYRERLKEVFANVYRLEVITNRFEHLVKRNRQAISELGRGALGEYDYSVQMVRDQILNRWRSVKDQLENEPKPLDLSKPAVIARWRQQNQGGARLGEAQIDGRRALHIASDGGNAASWRSAVILEAGKYRFEALVRCARVAPYRTQQGEGAGIRISGSTRRNKAIGDSPWTRLEYDFDLSAPQQVVLICELAAARGEAWFDRSSLKLTKLN